ncbi:hypothetical protein QNM97_03670 [Gordonia sp. L191]|uniref:hypothetical protein n=1 Tax=Gordonia sp. L191 TaxID=2982699 RepID=UPI0024C0C3BD|nr:hypothetical protein [Gordonia sp. L191]WHU48111.1 hypothetical protein QNM97_03670 [Gordonia sp. L191]
MSIHHSQAVAHGAFQVLGTGDAEPVDELLRDVFGRNDIATIGADWRGIVYFTLADDDEIDASTVMGFDASSGSSGPLATLDEVMAAVADGDIAEAVDAESFDAWRAATGVDGIAVGDCVPPSLPEFIGGDPAERAVEPLSLVSHIASCAALMGRIEHLGLAPGDDIPDEVFDATRWE